MLDMISVFLNLLSCDPRHGLFWRVFYGHLRRRCILLPFRWNVLKTSMRSISSNVSFKACVSLLIFCFDDLSIGVNGVLKSPTIIGLLSISPFMSVSVCLQRRQWHPTPVLLSGKSRGRRSLEGCRPWGL